MTGSELTPLEELAKEIENELKEDAENKAVADHTEKGARKPFRITEFDTPKDREMAVFTYAKKLSEYIFVITEKSPVKYRWNIVSRLLNTSSDVIENLYRANYERGEERTLWQKKAMVSLNLLDFYANTARIKGAINMRQTSIIARQICEVKKTLAGWTRSAKEQERKNAKKTHEITSD